MQKTQCKFNVKLCVYRQPLALASVWHLHGIEFDFLIEPRAFLIEKKHV
jgi:hypothetical protein